MHVQQRMTAVLLLWILWALRLVISLTSYDLSGMSLYHDFFFVVTTMHCAQ